MRYPVGVTHASASAYHSNAQHSIGIIGGGISGVSAAERLIDGLLPSNTQSVEIQLFDRGRSVGGRCSSKQFDVNGHRVEFNHGCQVICPRTDGFVQHVNHVWLKEMGVVRQCPPNHVVQLDSTGKRLESSIAENFIGHGREGDVYVGVPNMNAIVSRVAELQQRRYPQFKMKHSTSVTDISWVEDSTWPWRVTCDGEETRHFTHLVLADASALEIATNVPDQVTDGLRGITSVEYDPVFAFVAEINGSTGFEFDMALLDHHQDTTPLTPFSLISRQHNTWVALTTPRKAQEILHKWPMRSSDGTVIPQSREYRKAVADYLEPAFKKAMQYLGEDHMDMEWTFSHRWGRAFPRPTSVLSTPSVYIRTHGIGACGDACHCPPASPFESAWISGRHLADQIVQHISTTVKS